MKNQRTLVFALFAAVALCSVAAPRSSLAGDRGQAAKVESGQRGQAAKDASGARGQAAKDASGARGQAAKDAVRGRAFFTSVVRLRADLKARAAKVRSRVEQSGMRVQLVPAR